MARYSVFFLIFAALIQTIDNKKQISHVFRKYPRQLALRHKENYKETSFKIENSVMGTCWDCLASESSREIQSSSKMKIVFFLFS